MRSFARGEGCLMRFLQEALDDPAPTDCGRCSVCTGLLPPPGARPSAERVEAARVFARGRDVIIEPSDASLDPMCTVLEIHTTRHLA